jgi:predicted nucleotidyltransferase
VLSASLFGSVARGQARAGSDLDVAVRLEDIPSGFATFGRLDRVRRHLSQLLGVRVDVVPEPETPGPLKNAIDKDRRLAF